MEHNILDYSPFNKVSTPEAEKDLVTSPPGDLYQEILNNFKPGLCNEITITFSDKWIIPYNTKYIQIKLNDFLKRWQNVADYIFVQDYSQTGRLHYHGLLQMKKIDKYEREVINLRKTFGRVECKQITFWESYIKYMLGIYDVNHAKFNQTIDWNKTRYISNIL